MRDSTVLVVFLLVTLGSATGELNLTVHTVTCSSVRIDWTAVGNRAVEVVTVYNSTVHKGTKTLPLNALENRDYTTTLSDLVADTEYTITVTVRYGNDTITVSNTTTATTEPGVPSVTGIRTISGSTWLSFKVEAPGHYNCWVSGTGHYFFNVTIRNANTVAGLNPGTSYNITCQQRMDQNCPIAHMTVTTKPNPPDNVTITQTTCNSVTVNWTPPTDNGNAEITGYRVLVYNVSDHVLMTETDTAAMDLTYKFSSLDPDANYTVEVKAMNVGGVGNGTSTNFTTTKKDVRPITVSMVQSRKANITINGSGEVYSCTLNDQTMDITSGQPVQLTGLTQRRRYTVKCHSVTDSCLEATTRFTTKRRPGIVRSLKSGSVSVSGNGSNVQLQQSISWQPAGNVMMYLIRYGMGVSKVQDASFNVTTRNTSILLTLSVPDGPLNMVAYNIWVAIVTKFKEQGNFEKLMIQYKPPRPPLDLQLETVSCNSIQVSWLPPNSSLSGGLPLISYRVRYNGTELHNMARGEHRLEVDINGLQPNTPYAISVSANNTLGWGVEAQGSNTTMPRLTEVFHVSDVTSKNITVTATVAARSKHLQCNISMVTGMRNFTLTQKESLLLAGLTPNTQYTIHCVEEDAKDACTEQTMNVTTRKNPPGEVTNVRRDGHSWVAGGRIYQPITWDAPQGTEDNEVPETYVVRYRKRTSDTGTDGVLTNTIEISLNLTFPLPQQAVTYIVSVAGKAGTERGNFSDVLTLNYSTPGAPTGVIVQAQSCNTLNVTWSSPHHTGGLPITGYNISYTDTRTNIKLYGYSGTTMLSLQQLKPGTEYIVRVRAMNAIGEGEITQNSGNTSQRREGYVIVTANSAHSILFSYSLTESQESGVYYLCNVTEVKGGEKKTVNKRVTKEAMSVTKLLPDTTYKVDCVAYHSDGVEACLEANTTVNTRPDRLHNIIVRGSTVQSVHNNGSITIIQNITWDAPPNHHNIQHYLIKYQMQDQPTSSETRTSSNATQASLMILVPRGQTSTYSVQVAAVSKAGQGEFSDRVEFNYSTPNPPNGVNSVNSTCNSITLTWSAPHHTGRIPLERYAVRWRGRGSPLTKYGPNVTAVTVTHLLPNTSYTIDVSTVNAIGEGQRSEQISVITALQNKPLEVSVSTISSRSLRITAQLPPALEMVEVNCTLTAKETSSYIRTVSLDNTTDGGAQRLTDNLVPYTNYTATCLVFKDGVDQCYIGSDTTQTSTDRPSAPPQEVSPASTSSQSFTMTWAPPPKGQQNGEIVSYEVEYREEGSNSTVVNTTRGMRYTAEDLTTDRVYQFRVAANTVNGMGPFSEWIKVESIPTVTNLRVINTTTNSTTITWDQPPHNYRVFLHGEATDNIPQSRVIQLVNVTGQSTHIVEDLNSFRNYSISVYLEFNLGQGSSATVTFQTQGRAPNGTPTHLNATPTSRSVSLQWSPPPVLSRNGILTHYVVVLANETWNTTQSHSITGEQRKRREADSERVGEETQSLTVEHLRPFTTYTWEVAAVSGFGAGPSSDRRVFETDQDVPTQVESIRVNLTQKTITWAAPAEPNGIIVGYRVQYWELGRRDTTEEVNTTAVELVFSYSKFSAGVPHKVQVQAATVAGLGESRVVEEVLFSEEQAPTVAVTDITVTRVNDTAVRVTWTALTLNDARGFPSYVVIVTSKEREVANVTTYSTSVVVGGLMPHTGYNVTVQALTAEGTKEGPHSAPVTIEALPVPTDSSSPLTWILVVLIVVLIVAVVIFTVVVVVICRRYRSKNKTKPAGLWKDIPMKGIGVLQEGIHAPLDLGPITDPEDRIQRKEAVLKENFCEHVQKLHQDKNALFLAEYQSITQTPEGVRDSAFKDNVVKNRYVNIFPYDHSRVVLKERDSTGSDYINGAYIDAYNRANGYIATQGPTPDTLDDFWQMVWEHHAPVIVMLTKLIEKNKRKCERYWATELNEPFKPGRDLSVTILRCDTYSEFELRTIKVEKLTSKEDPLVVKHFLYTAWPDHGVPQYSVSIHRFIRQHVRPVYNDSSAPLIVHCSAGAGRTGTYMAIDTMMYQLEDRQNANIFEYVEKMRTRRTQMVQNASQYIYIHDAINDYINCKDTTIVAHELRPRIEELRQIDITTGSSGFVTQFSLLAEVSIKQCDADYAFAEEEDIMSRNRYRGLCPFSDKHLTKEDDSYVNASEILGYCGQRNFIAAQTPMKNTEGDVWEMIWMEKCAAVVVLCDFVEGKDEMCSKFWPLKMSEPKTFGNIKVCLDDKAEQASYNEYHLTVSFTNHPDPLNVVVFHYLQWPCHGRPSIPPYLQLMGEVERSQHNATGPTLVMCDDGMSRTGVFITTMAEVERVKVQGEVDIFQTVKAARSERPHMVSTPVDYEVCHDVLVSYLESFDTYANFK